MLIGVHAALIKLSSEPRSFLRENLVQVGDFAGPSGVKTALFQTGQLALDHQFTTGQRYGRTVGALKKYGIQEFLFGENAKVNFQTANVQVQFVQMYPYAGLHAIQWHQLAPTGPASPNIMITTKLTGCSFLVRSSPAGGIECAHIQPAGQTGEQLRQLLSDNHVGNYERLYGRGKSGEKGYADNEAATVIGVRCNGAWEIYAQRLVNQMNMLKELQPIYPR
jgi:hypothetical protein